jgi:hypothetical protein
VANAFANLPVPAGDGVGAWVNVSSLSPEKFVSVDGGAFSGTLLLEGSNDGQLSAFPLDVGPFIGPTFAPQDFAEPVNFMRVRRAASSAGPLGTPNVNVGGQSVTTNIFAAMVVPAVDGVGAAVDLTGGGDLAAFSIVGPFTGQIIVETSADGVNFSPTLLFTDGAGKAQSVAGVLNKARIRRRGVVGGGLPLAAVGSGGGGAGGGGGFPGFGPAPPAVASASSAGLAGTASRSDHTHALDLVNYTPSVAAMQGTGLVTQTAFVAGVATMGLTAIPTSFPGFGGAPPAVATASAAGVAGTASRSDHTHALDLVTYTPSVAGMQAAGVIQQTFPNPTAVPAVFAVAADLITFGAHAGTGLLSTNAAIKYDSSLGRFGISRLAQTVDFTVARNSGTLVMGADAASTNLRLYRASTDNIGLILDWDKSRGTRAAPTAVIGGDFGNTTQENFYDGTGYTTPMAMVVRVQTGAAVAANSVPALWAITVANGGGVTAGAATQNALAQYTNGDTTAGGAQVANADTGGFFLPPAVAGPPVGVPVNSFGTALVLNRVPTIIDNTNQRLYGYMNAAWHFAQFMDFDPTATQIPFGGATAHTLTSAAQLTFSSAVSQNRLTVGGPLAANAGSVLINSGDLGVPMTGALKCGLRIPDITAGAQANIAIDNIFFGQQLMGYTNGAFQDLVVGVATGHLFSLGYLMDGTGAASVAGQLDGTTGAIVFGDTIAGGKYALQVKAAAGGNNADAIIGNTGLVAASIHGYGYVAAIAATPTGAADVFGNGGAAVAYDTNKHGLWARNTVGAQWEFVPAANSTQAAGAGVWVTTNLPAGFGTTPKYWSFTGFGGAVCVVPYFTNP